MRGAPEQYSINQTNFKFREQNAVYRGKVRDVYDIGDQLIIIATDRISAFDHILPRPIPFKGQVLNQVAAHFLQAVQDICPVWLESCPDPNVSVGKKCQAIPIEMVVRGYLAGHAWRIYKNGGRSLCGVSLEEGMVENQKLPTAIITPTTKAAEGHDQDVSMDEILELGLVSKEILDTMSNLALALYRRGSEMAAEQGLILVDTKYEFGLYEDHVMLMDEVHTPDSSRYFEMKSYAQRLAKGEPQIQLSKEFVREWLMAHGFEGKVGQIMPEMPDTFVW
ncbi:MAG TPA: phosphoribosylaminoimidazolesuccinocarboxamide synthase, partial [Saprospiraceae bacterium]|nr:phosphoribosylaminoimidazolesuccinocarboxamide synthase [Saprospiraceae bacterium]